MPFSSYAEEPGIIGSNLGLDFYSRIDDAGDALSQGIIDRRLSEKRTYGSLGCGVSWIADISIDRRSLDALASGNTAILIELAGSKKVDLTMNSESGLRQCIVEKYNEIQRAAHQDQDALETAGNVGLYMDGDIVNSDYDITADITRINSIIFKQRFEYTGSKNASAQAIADMLAGKAIAPLFPSLGGAGVTGNSGNPTAQDPSNPGNSTTTKVGSDSPGATTTTTLPWAWVCQVGSSGSAGTSGGLFGDGFFDGIDTSLAGGSAGGGLAYTPGRLTGGASSAASAGSSSADFGLSEWSDFFHTLPCEGILCITIDMISGNKGGNAPGNSIEWLLERHSEMMDPISRSDLALQKMTNAMYQEPFENLKFKNLIPKNLVKIEQSPQLAKTLKKEDTKAKKDDVFDEAFRCAMAEAGLPGDLMLANGFGWAGYSYLTNQTTANIGNRVIPVTPSEMDNLAGCYALRMWQWQSVAYQGLSTDLNEIQAFTSAMMSIIMSIIESDKVIDKLPTK